MPSSLIGKSSYQSLKNFKGIAKLQNISGASILKPANLDFFDRSVGLPIVTSGLQLYLDAYHENSYPGYGTSWNDLSSNQFVGTLRNGVSFTLSGGPTLVFDGTDDFVDIPHSTTLNGSLNMTLCAWINPSAIFNSTPIFGKGTSSSGSGGYDFRIDTSPSESLNLVKYFVVDQRGTYDFSTGIWYNVVAVQGGSSVNFFVNGQSAGSYSDNRSYQTNTTTFKIGAARDNGYYWNGKIAQVMFYNKQLSNSEILQNYNATKNRFS